MLWRQFLDGAIRGWRRPRLPGALIIGAQKSGTTALASYLAQHPRLSCSKEKEVDFFGSDLRYGRGLHWYASQWPDVDAGMLRFEASPQYLWKSQAAARIHAVAPAVRLIAIVRDPVKRAYSAWRMYRRQLAGDPLFYEKFFTSRYGAAEYAKMARRTPAELDDFCLAIRQEVEHIARGVPQELALLDLGLYGPQLQGYTTIFPREQLLILDSEDLRRARIKTLNRVLAHLSLEPFNWSKANLADVFVGASGPPMPAAAYAFLRDYYVDSNQVLTQLMNRPPAWAAARRASPQAA